MDSLVTETKTYEDETDGSNCKLTVPSMGLYVPETGIIGVLLPPCSMLSADIIIMGTSSPSKDMDGPFAKSGKINIANIKAYKNLYLKNIGNKD
ncbi:MAG: hypothetical protein IJ584_14185 [Bacteroidales bacterium]|nr:hypothetical protein [Bacteroidales bacterium]